MVSFLSLLFCYGGYLVSFLRRFKDRAVFLILPILFFQGNLLHQSLLSALSINDFSKNYYAFNLNNWKWMEFLGERLKDEDASKRKVMVAPDNREYFEHFRKTAESVFFIPGVETGGFDESFVGDWDYLISIADHNNPYGDAFIPRIWNGYILKKIDQPGEANKALLLASGDWLSFTIALPQEVTICGINFLGDTLTWHHKLDLGCRIEKGEQRVEGVIKGDQIPRIRYSPPAILFDRPLRCRATEQLRITMNCAYQGGNLGEGKKVGLIAMQARELDVKRVVFNGKQTNISPEFILYVGKPLPDGFKKVFDYEYTQRSFITMSPYAIFKFLDEAWVKGWSRDFFRNISYSYGVEIYENK
jgi:hypothetical protein